LDLCGQLRWGRENWFGWGRGKSRRRRGRSRFKSFFDSLLEGIDLIGFQTIQLAGDARETKFLANIDENLAFKVQFLGQGENPDLFVLFFDLRIRQALLPWECDEHPQIRPLAIWWF
jgi:hypothetical protein